MEPIVRPISRRQPSSVESDRRVIRENLDYARPEAATRSANPKCEKAFGIVQVLDDAPRQFVFTSC